jgi:hypothetical protein
MLLPVDLRLPDFDDIIRVVGAAALRVLENEALPKTRKSGRRQPSQEPVKVWLKQRYAGGVPESKTDTVLVHEAGKDGVVTNIDAVRRATGRKK